MLLQIQALFGKQYHQKTSILTIFFKLEVK